MNVKVTMTTGDTLNFKSRFETLPKAFMELSILRFIVSEGAIYSTAAIVKIEEAKCSLL